MCNYCEIPLYIKVQQYLRPATAPMTRAGELMDEYTNITGMAFVLLEKRFCPMCGREMEGRDENA